MPVFHLVSLMKKAFPLLLVILLLSAGGSWFFVFRVDTQALLAAGIPARPKDSPVVPALATRLDNAEQDIRTTGRIEALQELSRLYHANGFYAEASQCYASLMELEPKKALWPHLLANILSGYGQLDDAIPLYQRAGALDPSYLPTQVRLGDVLLKANKPKEAEAAYTAALKIASDNPYALQGLARIEMLREQWDSARIHLEEAARISDYAIGGDLLVNAYEKTGREALARSLRAKQKAAGLFYDLSDPWLDGIYIDCYDPYRAAIASGSAARIKDFDTAIRLLEHVHRIAPNYALGYYQMGFLQQNLGNLPKAILAYEKSAELDPSFSDTWVKLVRLHNEQNNPLGASLALEKGLKACPHSPHLHTELAGRLVRANRNAEADKEYKRVLVLRPDEAFPYINYAKFLFGQERIEEAAAILDKGLQIEPEEPMMLTILAFHAITIGDEAKARNWIQHLKDQPRTPQGSLKSLLDNFKNQFGKSF